MCYGELWFLFFKLGETCVLHSGDEIYPQWSLGRAVQLYYREAFFDGLNYLSRLLVMLNIIRLKIRVINSGEYLN